MQICADPYCGVERARWRVHITLAQMSKRPLSRHKGVLKRD